MRWIDRVLVGLAAAGIWTAIAIYAFSPQPVLATDEYPQDPGSLADFIMEVVEGYCWVESAEVLCGF